MDEPSVCRKTSAIKKYVFIKGSSEPAGGTEQSSVEVKEK